MYIFDLLIRVVELLVSSLTLGVLCWGLYKMFQSAREAEKVRKTLLASNIRTEDAARLAVDHAAETRQQVELMAQNVQKIETASNSMKDALVASTERAAGLAGEQRGRDQMKREEP